MGKRIKTIYTDDDRGWAEIHMDVKDEHFYIKYFTELGSLISIDEYPNKPLIEVEEIAKQWISNYK